MTDNTVSRRAFTIGLGASATTASMLSAAPAMAQTEIITNDMLNEGTVVLKMSGGIAYQIESTQYFSIDMETSLGRISMLDWLGAASLKGFKPQSKTFLLTADATNLEDLSQTDLQILKTGASPVVTGSQGQRTYMFALDWYYCESI